MRLSSGMSIFGKAFVFATIWGKGRLGAANIVGLRGSGSNLESAGKIPSGVGTCTSKEAIEKHNNGESKNSTQNSLNPRKKKPRQDPRLLQEGRKNGGHHTQR